MQFNFTILERENHPLSADFFTSLEGSDSSYNRSKHLLIASSFSVFIFELVLGKSDRRIASNQSRCFDNFEIACICLPFGPSVDNDVK